jgi:quinoprotein glucose dehydrogenase
MRRTLIAFGLVGVTVLAIGHLRAQGPANVPADQWPNYQHNSNFSPLTQITPANVSRLTKAWTFNFGGGTQESWEFVSLDYRFQVQPLLIDGVMYLSTPASLWDPSVSSTVTALEPETGTVIWQYQSPRRIHGRGIAYWQGNGSVGPRLYFATDKGYMMALDMKTGELADGFGNGGEVDAYVGVASEVVGEKSRDTFTIPNPITVYKNLLVTGARPMEGSPPQPRGDIRAWDAVTGQLVWSFHTIPWPGEANHEDWTGDTWKDRSGCNVWSNLTADEANGMVFGATGDSNHANTAPGKNLYCNSILALDGDTGTLKWYYQLIHHEQSDWDMPTPPLLVDVRQNGRVIPAVLQTGKIHLVWMFNRLTGEPIFGIEERPTRGATPGGTGDVADARHPDAPNTQPIPVKPPPTGRVFMTHADLNTMTPEIEKGCAEIWANGRYVDGAPYARSTPDEPVITFGQQVGGWGPLSYNPELGYAFLNVSNGRGGTAAPPATVAAAPAGRGNAPAGRGGGRGGGSGGGRGGDFSYRLPSGASVSCVAPPYGALVAVNVNTGDIAWNVPLGRNEILGKELGEAGYKAGTPNIGGSVATASGLVFIGASIDSRFRAFDARSGAELWVADLPANGNATPMTYMGKDGAQYVVIAAAGGGPAARGLPASDALVAFKLP